LQQKNNAKKRCKTHRDICLSFYKGISTTAATPTTASNVNNRDASHTVGTPTTKWTQTTVETPGTEGMSTTAGPQQHQNATQEHYS
jgi:hypothetical protein